MKFGAVSNPDEIDFSLPPDHLDTDRILSTGKGRNDFEVYVGCGTWNKVSLTGFYPKRIKDELSYYSTQFNSIELNATFYQPYNYDQYQSWSQKSPADFKFFPKLNQTVTHLRRLNNVTDITILNIDAARGMGDKLGGILVQLHDRFKPKDFGRLKQFVEILPKDVSIAIETRDEEWFRDKRVSGELFYTLETAGIINVITDTAARRDLLHMRLSTPSAYIRWVGTNHKSDYTRLDQWIDRISSWKEKGLEKVTFIIHQNEEENLVNLAAYLIKNLNMRISTSLKIPGLLL